jgi:hypothetical protein
MQLMILFEIVLVMFFHSINCHVSNIRESTQSCEASQLYEIVAYLHKWQIKTRTIRDRGSRFI